METRERKTAKQVKDFISNLAKKYSSIKEVWLFGSRANDNVGPYSDWDLFVFADNELLTSLRKNKSLENSNIDIIVVNKDGLLTKLRNDNPYFSSLTEWKWKKLSENEAQYDAKYSAIRDPFHEIDEESGFKPCCEDIITLKTIRIWNRDTGFMCEILERYLNIKDKTSDQL